MITRKLVATVALSMAATFLAAEAMAQCPLGSSCTEYTGAGKKGSYFRILVPDVWDGDLFIINHGFDLNRLNIQGHNLCQKTNPLGPDVDCSVGGDADCAAVPGIQKCNKITLFGFEDQMIPLGKAVAATTYSQTGWSTYQSAKDLKDILKFMKKEPGVGSPTRTIVSGFSMGGAVTVDAMVKLKAGKDIHGAVPLCPCSGGGLPTWDTASDLHQAYAYLCNSVPSGSFDGVAVDEGVNWTDLGSASISMAGKINTCFGNILPSGDPIEAAAQAQRFADFITLTQFAGTTTGASAEFLTVGGYVFLGMGDHVFDKKRGGGKRFGFNTGLDYTNFGTDPVLAADFDVNVQRLTEGKGRKKLNKKGTLVTMVKGKGKKINYPTLSYAGDQDWVCIPEFQNFLAASMVEGGKDFVQVWGSNRGHCLFTEQELSAVTLEYFDWLDTYDTVTPDVPSGLDTEARCLALPGALAADCNFDNTGFVPPTLASRVPPRPDWPVPAQTP